MNPDTEAKIMVAFVISLIAFGFGTSASILVGISQNSSLSNLQFNLTVPEFPQYTLTPNPTNLENNEKTEDQNTESSDEIYIEKPKKKSPDNTSQKPTNQT
ncbi:MAG: hypothetical protein FJ150_03480 [Euryarchaeota archaeon]|nr:hypothetical protein [Euryarchaeota archaeon]